MIWKKSGPRTIWLDCDVLQADGGTRTAAITGSFVALSLAVRALMAKGKLATSPMLKPVAAVSVGIVQSQALLDLSYVEDVAAAVDMNLVMNAAGEFIELQGTGEESTYTDEQLAAMLAVGKAGIEQLLELQQAALTDQLVPGQIVGRFGQQPDLVILSAQDFLPKLIRVRMEDQIQRSRMGQPVLARHFLVELARPSNRSNRRTI